MNSEFPKKAIWLICSESKVKIAVLAGSNLSFPVTLGQPLFVIFFVREEKSLTSTASTLSLRCQNSDIDAQSSKPQEVISKGH